MEKNISRKVEQECQGGELLFPVRWPGTAILSSSTWINFRKGRTKLCGHLGECMFQVEGIANAKGLFHKII